MIPRWQQKIREYADFRKKRTTKGIIGAIRDAPTYKPLERTDWDIEYEKMVEDIMSYTVTSKGPKMVHCIRCGTTVTAGKDSDCECGYIKELFDGLSE